MKMTCARCQQRVSLNWLFEKQPWWCTGGLTPTRRRKWLFLRCCKTSTRSMLFQVGETGLKMAQHHMRCSQNYNKTFSLTYFGPLNHALIQSPFEAVVILCKNSMTAHVLYDGSCILWQLMYGTTGHLCYDGSFMLCQLVYAMTAHVFYDSSFILW